MKKKILLRLIQLESKDEEGICFLISHRQTAHIYTNENAKA